MCVQKKNAFFSGKFESADWLIEYQCDKYFVAWNSEQGSGASYSSLTIIELYNSTASIFHSLLVRTSMTLSMYIWMLRFINICEHTCTETPARVTKPRFLAQNTFYGTKRCIGDLRFWYARCGCRHSRSRRGVWRQATSMCDSSKNTNSDTTYGSSIIPVVVALVPSSMQSNERIHKQTSA